MFPTYALLATAPVFGLAVYCLSHLAACKMIRNRGNYFPLVIGCACGLAATAVTSVAALIWMQSSLADGFALAGINMLAYLAFAFGYFNFINLNIASLRIRMLQELAEAGGRLPAEHLTGLYSTETVIAVRIDRLARGRHLIERDGRYYSGKWQFLFVARTFDLLRWAILGQRTQLTPRDGICRNESRLESNTVQPSLKLHLPERDEYVEPVSQLSP
jgi:hypothetical protein